MAHVLLGSISTMDGVALNLLRRGLGIPLKVLREEVRHSPGDKAEFTFEIELRLEGDDEDFTPEGAAEGGAMGVLFLVASLAFASASPRGISENYYLDDDELTVDDLLAHLRFRKNCLSVDLDYLRGRRVKTRVTVASDGTARIETQGRGKAALNWLAQTRGERRLTLVRPADG